MNEQIITYVLIAQQGVEGLQELAQEGAPAPEGLLKLLPLLPWIAIGLFFLPVDHSPGSSEAQGFGSVTEPAQEERPRRDGRWDLRYGRADFARCGRRDVEGGRKQQYTYQSST